ncbi:hypothetical protein D9613_011574 [Agrocybe pediades]|uniref:Uncharacterized protein n=1 Tax=Agrocybe pediades TaxID=84607 RepID=A0A8H4QVY6_9AGAR|nr:hypothetical protein D9613_011574 [Agrocybe pediades]
MIEEEVQRPVLTSDDTGAGLSVSGHPAIRSTLYSTPTSSFLDRLLLATAVSFALSLYVPYKLERLPYIKINLVSIGQSATNKINQVYDENFSPNLDQLYRTRSTLSGFKLKAQARRGRLFLLVYWDPLNCLRRPWPRRLHRLPCSYLNIFRLNLSTGAKPSLPSPHRPQPFFFPQLMVTQASTQLRQWFQQEFKGRCEDTAIPPPLPRPAFPAITEYYPTSVVPAGMCSFPENSGASPPSTRPSLQRI